jgi:hypothetical protein
MDAGNVAFAGAAKETAVIVAKEATETANATQAQVNIAAAYAQSEVAGLKAAAAEQARIDVLEKGGDVGARTQQILASQAAEALAATAKTVPALQQQIDATTKLANATGEGAEKAHEAALQNQVTAATHDALNKAIATGNPALIDEAKNLTAVVEAQIRANDAAQTALQLRQAELNNGNMVEQLQLEAQLQGQTSEEIQRQVSLLQAKQLLQSKGVDLASEEAQKYLASVDQLGKANIALGDAARNSQRVSDTLTSIGQTIDSDIMQNLEAAFSGQKIQSWGSILKSVLAQTEAQMISLTLIKPAIGSVLSASNVAPAAVQFGEFPTEETA